MTASFWQHDPWDLLAELRRLIAQRVPAETEIGAEFESQRKRIERQYQRLLGEINDRQSRETADAQLEYDAVREELLAQCSGAEQQAQQVLEHTQREIAERFEQQADEAEETLRESRWQIQALFEADRGKVTAGVGEVQAQLEALWQEMEAVQQQAVSLLRRLWQWRAYPDPTPGRIEGDPFQFVQAAPAAARARLLALANLKLPRLFERLNPLWYLCLLWGLLTGPAIWLFGWANWWFWLAGSGAGAVVVAGLLGQSLYHVAARQCARAYAALRQTMLDADLARRMALEAYKAGIERKVLTLAGQRNAERKQFEEQHAAKMLELERNRDTQQAAVQARHDEQMARLSAQRETRLRELLESFERRNTESEQRQREESARLEEKRRRKLEANQKHFQERWDAMAEQWTSGMAGFGLGLDEVNRECQRLFLDWARPNGNDWAPAKQMPHTVPFGRFAVDLAQIKGGLPRDERLVPPQTEFSVPATFPCRDRSLLLLKATGEGLGRAVEAIQGAMLQMLTAIPPGKIRFTIVDPVGLGENFSAFMHLADYNDQLVSSRIWVDPDHIEHRLAELTGHMENVIQVYLRNEFHTIEEYNRFAGDLAEPYRVLVVANFPNGFSETAAARLLSIVASGARCGVYTILSLDTRLRMPREFHLADLERQAVILNWQQGQFTCTQPDLRDLPLTLLSPPAAEDFTRIVRAVGREAKDADRVELPFECIVPERDQWWTTESAAGIDVPLGRAGAMKFQYLRLGRGTSQHVLIAGKTGSGKSTLLHALVTNVALRYSPDQVELYLIDFKKGVEFKDYAQWSLPHARVIAIESEREFGLSVLERLDAELKVRGDLFRNLGVQDLPGFREARPGERLPRILLIVDEFQELFVEDDRIAQNASLLLDRLVRQGRAFGIHVLLGSQTLAGSFSLPRSTIGQMAVRIALQCSESDAHLILSEENTAARLLQRPGEAIYNDANGLFEGNHPFQVVWLPDDRREAYLREVQETARAHQYTVRPPIVFEGNLPADLSKNDQLQALLAAADWPAAEPAPRVWLGSAVAIKEATAVAFARQAGANLLVVGHQEDEARGVFTSCLLSLAAQLPPSSGNGSGLAAQFVILDGTRGDSPHVGYWERLSRLLPQASRVTPIRGTGAAMAEIAAELSSREQSEREDFAPLYLMIFDLPRFRDLRKAEDDFSFSRSDDKPADPATLLARILRDGPAVGIHTLVWCDTYHNLNRSIDRQGLRDLELRVVFQMNVTDSSNLIDSPAASQLGVHRALVYNEGEGRLEKFRPYGPPEERWLAWAAEQLQRRAANRAPSAAAAAGEQEPSEA